MDSPTDANDKKSLIPTTGQYQNPELSPGIYYYPRTPTSPTPSRYFSIILFQMLH